MPENESPYEVAVRDVIYHAFPFRRAAYERWLNMHRARLHNVVADLVTELDLRGDSAEIAREIIRRHL